MQHLQMFDVYGSMHSLLPRICDVDAVGIGASSSELRAPWINTSSFKAAQSQRSLGLTPLLCDESVRCGVGECMFKEREKV
jgi:hypothetical protein